MNQDRDEKILQQIAAGYDAIATDFSRTRSKMWPEVVHLTKAIPEGTSVLDLGCGNGRLYQEFAGKAIEYSGIDASLGLVTEARKLHPEIAEKFQVGSVTALPYESDSIDSVFSIAVWHHLPSEKVRHAALREVGRVLKPHGALILTVWNLWQPRFWKYHFKTRRFGDVEIPWEDGKKFMRYCHAFTVTELKKLAEENGFTVIDAYYSDGTKKSSWWKGRNIVLIAEVTKAS